MRPAIGASEKDGFLFFREVWYNTKLLWDNWKNLQS